MKVTVALTDIAEALLQRVPGSSDAIRAATLWQSKPYIVICLRRPGCVGCRKIAQDYWKRREEIEGAGVGMAVIVNQTLPGEIEDFKEKIWGGDVFLDKEQAFYRAVGEGKVRRGSLWPLLNPFSRAMRNMFSASKSVEHHNLKGDGFTFGGVLVVAKGDQGVPFAFQENTFGDAPDVDEVVQVAKDHAAKR